MIDSPWVLRAAERAVSALERMADAAERQADAREVHAGLEIQTRGNPHDGTNKGRAISDAAAGRMAARLGAEQ